jgi:hypothetical protein
MTMFLLSLSIHRYYEGMTIDVAPPTLVRLDYAVNWHFFGVGPDPTRFRNGSFSTRWEGEVTPDATVTGALLQLILSHGHPGAPVSPKDMGGRVYATRHFAMFVNGDVIVNIDLCSSFNPVLRSCFSKGHGRSRVRNQARPAISPCL